MIENNEPPARKVALSARAIEKMKPDSFRADIGEYEGLRVACGKTGLKSFIYRYRSPIDNKLKKVKIGTYPDISLAEARVVLLELKAQRRAGRCPAAETKELKQIKKQQLATQPSDIQKNITVKDMIELYLTNVIEDRFVKDPKTEELKKIPGARKLKGQLEARRTLYCDVVGVLGELLASDITRKEVVILVKGIIDRGAKVQAGRVLSEFTNAYEYAIGLEMFGDNFANPALLAKANFKQARVKLTSNKRKRMLNDDELIVVLKWLPTSGFSSKHQSILKIALWTGCRTGEACNAEWKDINLDKSTWHIRESKNEAERYVQLPKQCVEHLRNLLSKNPLNQSYLFTSERTNGPLRQKTISEAKWRLKTPDKVTSQKFRPEQLWPESLADWNPHDLRRTVRTALSRLGCPNDVAEAVIGHSKKGIEGTYNLHLYESECRMWLQKWADYIDELLIDK